MVSSPISGVQVMGAAQTQRVPRYPQHPFHLIDQRPYQIQPFVCAPVLPGETLKNALVQARIVTDPLASPLIGWWAEHYMFYVKVRDLNGREDFQQMFIDPAKDMSAYDDATSAKTYHLNGTPTPAINWVNRCLRRVTETYFRAQGEAWDAFTLDGLPLAQVNTKDIRDSLETKENVEDPVDIDLTDVGSEGGAAVTTREIDNAMRNYQILRDHSMLEMTFESFLATYGINMPKEESHIPELLRYTRNWTYPSNTINPSDGAPSSACSWAIRERADKDRKFKEPGFVFGVQIIRPKVYSATFRSSFTSLMNEGRKWLPALMAHDPWTSLEAVSASAPPLTQAATDYIVDLKDLFLYGEQFLNFDPNGTAANGAINLPLNTVGTPDTINTRYPTSADVDSLFAGISPANKIDTDGITSFNILGRQTDTTPNAVGSGTL